VQVNYSSLIRFLQQQSVYIALSAVLGAVFWAIGQPIDPVIVMVYSLSIGNLIAPAIRRLHFLYADRPFPYNWLIFLPVLFVLLLPVYLISSAVAWAIELHSSQTYVHLVRTGWKLPYLVTFVFGVLVFLYQTTKERLERRNAELQHTVEAGTARLELQEQELQRAEEMRRFSGLCCPSKFRRFQASKLRRHGCPHARWGAITTTYSGWVATGLASASPMSWGKAFPQRCSWPMCRRRCVHLPLNRRARPACAQASTGCCARTSRQESL